MNRHVLQLVTTVSENGRYLDDYIITFHLAVYCRKGKFLKFREKI